MEGYAENILIPALAELIGMPLHRDGVSIVNVEGTSFKQYVKLFSQKDGNEKIQTPISVVTDSDIKPKVFSITRENSAEVLKLVDKPESLDDQLMGSTYATFSALVKAFGLEYTNTNANALRQQVTTPLTDAQWGEQLAEKQNKLTDMYGKLTATSKVLLSPLWTLEYTLLHSSLRRLMIQAIAETQYNPQKSGDLIKTFEATYESNFQSAPHQAAYNAYVALDKGSVSKTQVSERLVELINELDPSTRETLKSKILGDDSEAEDQYCKYLVDAIKFASGRGAN